MFRSASAFNQDISGWDVSNVSNMSTMFTNATVFNQDISGWDVSNVTNMSYAFYDSTAFNQDISDWDVSSVTNMTEMFENTPSLSNSNKGEIQKTFSSNVQWPYDWSAFVTYITLNDSNFFTARDLWFSDKEEATKTYGHIRDWDVSAVTNMSNAFISKNTFNEDISGWDVSSVTNMANMFQNASAFNHDISDWDVSSANNMLDMFSNTDSLNNSNRKEIQKTFSSNINWPYDWSGLITYTTLNDSNFLTARDLWFSDKEEATKTYGHIRDWDVSAVTNMSNAFISKTTFNEDISGWDISSVTNMANMFQNASAFNQDISNWDVSSVTTMTNMFQNASAFNQDISGWDVSNVTNMSYAFYDATAFNRDISDWDVSSVTNMTEMFENTPSLSNSNKGEIQKTFSSNVQWPYDWSAFVTYITLNDSNFFTARDLWFSDKEEATKTYGHIRDWDVSAVTNMSNAFFFKTNFNEDISDWDVSSVTNMFGMFSDTSAFNQNISNWDVSSVNDMSFMFINATAFNQDISDWDVSSVTTMMEMFKNSPALSNSNKGEIQKTFSSNVHWPYDWSAFVTYITLNDSNFQSAVTLWFSDEAAATNSYGHIRDWDVSAVTDMSFAFFLKTNFNEDIKGWDVSSVNNMAQMFNGATAFNQDISNWDVSLVTTMTEMFKNTSSLSNSNKVKIQKTFSSNVNWPYDWSALISFTPIDDSNFYTAVDLWFSDELSTIKTYGHISDWDVSAVTNMSSAFNLKVLDKDISRWDVSSVTNMSKMFKRADTHLLGIRKWDVSSVKDMSSMFEEHKGFYENIEAWDVSNVQNMSSMFKKANISRLHVGSWNVSSVTNMTSMFEGIDSFFDNINRWDVSSVKDMSNMFKDTRFFNQPIGGWDVSSVTNMSKMFNGTESFNKPLSNWNVSSVTNMIDMFEEAKALSKSKKGDIHKSFRSNPHWPYDWSAYFNILDDSNFGDALKLWFENQSVATASYGHISTWNVSAVTDMSMAFSSRNEFNEDIGDWNVSAVTNMSNMFRDAHSFNSDISKWDVGSVIDMDSMFLSAYAFNKQIGDWNVSAVTNMSNMFQDAASFNMFVGNWDISKVTKMTKMFEGTVSLSKVKKGQIHKSFQSNPNWPYDWSFYFNILDDSNFRDAIKKWFENQPAAITSYGHISTWNVSEVTDMSSTFYRRYEFNEDIGDWNVSAVTRHV